MRRLAAVILFAVLVTGSGFGQSSNTTAGLAGVGAGTALGGVAGQGATTPSSATGGGGAGGSSSPIEIQIMTFHGLQNIAAGIAKLTFTKIGCKPASTDVPPNYQGSLDQDKKDLKEAIEGLIKATDEQDMDLTKKVAKSLGKLSEDLNHAIRESDGVSNPQGRTRIARFLKQLNLDRDKLDVDKDNLDKAKKALEETQEESSRTTETKKITELRYEIANLRELVNQDRDILYRDIDAFRDNIDGNCSILVEDAASANQVALYQVLEGHYSHLHSIDKDLKDSYFSIQVGSPTTHDRTFSVRVTNVGSKPRQIKLITFNPASFIVDAENTTCKEKGRGKNPFPYILQPQEYCDIAVNMNPEKEPPKDGSQPKAAMNIPSGEPASAKTDTTLTVQLTWPFQLPPPKETAEQKMKRLQEKIKADIKELEGAIEAAKKAPKNKSAQLKIKGSIDTLTTDQKESSQTASQFASEFAATSATMAATTAPAATTGGGATTPVDMTYLSNIMTALGGIKSNISYSPSSFQPTTQAFQIMVESELKAKGIQPYTSTSALNLEGATNSLNEEFGNMLAWGNEVTAWTNQCKPSTGNATPAGATPQTSSPANSACSYPEVVANLAAAPQLITGYTGLLTTANDGSGNPTIADVLRGKALSDKMKEGIPSLQVTVAAAGGSSKTNSYFGVNLVHTFAPSYNAGVIATFELRDKHNDLIQSGARSVLFRYKWRKPAPGKYKDIDPSKNGDCGYSFCSQASSK